MKMKIKKENSNKQSLLLSSLTDKMEGEGDRRGRGKFLQSRNLKREVLL